MRKTARLGAEDARSQLPELLEAAQKGNSTIISKYGRPVAALVPIEEYDSGSRQRSLLPLRGSGKKLWGKDSVRTLRRLRVEWNR
jgi:prevent-host-death family protein